MLLLSIIQCGFNKLKQHSKRVKLFKNNNLKMPCVPVDNLSHSVQVSDMLNKLRTLLGLFYQNKNYSCSCQENVKKLFFSTLDYCFNTVNQSFIITSPCRTCHFAFFSLVSWSHETTLLEYTYIFFKIC